MNMPHVQVRDMRPSLHRALTQHAKRARKSVSQVVTEAIERELRRDAFLSQLQQVSPVETNVDVAGALLAAREELAGRSSGKLGAR